MKMIHCDLCATDIVLERELQTCKCNNIAGMYQENGVYADIFLKDEDSFKTSRVIGVNNSVMLGYSDRDVAHIGDWNDYQLAIYVNGKLQKYEEVKKPVVPWEEYAEIMALLMEINDYTPDDIKDSKRMLYGSEYRMIDGGKVCIVSETEEIKEPMAVCIKIKDGNLIETKVRKFVMR